MKTDAELLRQFVSSRDEDAFTELVKRHIGIVYSAACCETQGDVSAAQDVTQLVFIELARKAPSLLNHPTLAGWLYVSARYVSANLRRTDRRRKIHEQQAGDMNELTHPDPTDPTWQDIRSVLNDAMHELNADDRDAVLLRYFEGKSLREVGDALCLTENTARMRVTRALEKLQSILAKRGVHSTSSVLAGALVAGMVGAPPTLVATVTNSALAAASVSAASTATLFGVMTMTKSAMVGLSALAVVAVSIPLWQHQRNQNLAEENTALRSQLEQTGQLREENQRLTDLLKAADQRAQNESLQPIGLRTAAAAAPKSGEQKKVPEGDRGEIWRQRFEAAYMLRKGEVLRRISPPFIPERAEYCRREFGNQKRVPDYLILGLGGKGLHPSRFGFVNGNPNLEDVLRYGLRLRRYEFYGTDELLAAAVPGDWVIRPSAGIESRLAALEPILRDATGHNIRFVKSPTGLDVIVVRGSFAPEKAGQEFDIFAENKDRDLGKSSYGDFQQFLKALGDYLNIPFANEAQLQNQLPISWFCHADADYSRAGNRRLELLNKVLANLNQQTSLAFEFEHRSGQVWWVKE